MGVMLLAIMFLSLLTSLPSSQTTSQRSSQRYERSGEIKEFKRKKCSVMVQTFQCPEVPKSLTIIVCQDAKNVNCSLYPDQCFGVVESGETASINCSNNQEGTLKRKCLKNGIYGPVADFCVTPEISNMLKFVQNKSELRKNLGNLIVNLADISQEQTISTPGNLIATVDIVKAFASVTNISLNESVMQDFFVTVNAVVDESTVSAWKTAKTQTSSSQLLKSIESFARLLSPNENTFNIIKPNIQLKGIKVQPNSNQNYLVDFNNLKVRNISLNSSVSIDQEALATLPDNSLVISIASATLIDILDQSSNTEDFRVNGLIMTTLAESSSIPIQINFLPLNRTLDPSSSQCVFWKYNLNGTGGWDSMGCRYEINGNNIVCKCIHLTSFSLLMSRFAIKSHKLSLITNITVGISVGCLVISFILEAIVWKHVTKNRTSLARHVIMLNIILFLLTANISFIVAQYLKPDTKICMVIVFFIHFLYLALFFWMFILGLLLLYHLIFLFKNLSKAAMVIISLTLGYLCPLIISTSIFLIGYIRKHYLKRDKCWMNTEELYILLSFNVPQLAIVTINVFITIVAIFKMLRPTIGEKQNSHANIKNMVKQIARGTAILTSILGLCWALGFAFLKTDNSIVIHYAFDILNGLQGLFILVFGVISDSKVQETLIQRFSLSPEHSQKSKLLLSSTSNSQ